MNSKKVAGEKAVEYVKDGMIVGLGTGTTVYYSIVSLAEKVRNGLQVKAVSTSNKTTELAKNLGIEVIPFNEIEYVDLTIDGADEVDNLLNGIKGGGGALLYEKLIAISSRKVIWVVDKSKKVDFLGAFPLPVEIVPFAYHQIMNKLIELNLNPVIRQNDDGYYLTDGGHFIIDLFINKIDNPYELHKTLKLLPGIVETGLFIEIADTVIIGDGSTIEIIEKK